jgi:dTDP-4-amino-4,6-dideoxygalactose transaminase
MDKMIPFNKPYVPEASKKYVMEALESNHQQGDGPFTKRASKMVSDLVGGGHILLTPSCTHALEMASMLGNFGLGDEVILPSYTFTSAATAVTKFGATPVFVDIDPVTKGIDANQVAEAVTDKTVAISWVNYAGVAPDIEALQSIAKAHNLLLIEDNAHGLGGAYKGKPLGSFGDFATQSFHATKNIQCGEGGALIINNPKFIERAEIIREKGTNRSQFVRGEVQKYQWIDNGSSYLLADVLAAQLLGSLEEFNMIQKNRSYYWNSFARVLQTSNDNEIYRISKFEGVENNTAHILYIEFNNARLLQESQERLKKKGVCLQKHYQPLHNSSAAKKLQLKNKSHFLNTLEASEKLHRIPIWSKMEDGIVSEIIEALLDLQYLR